MDNKLIKTINQCLDGISSGDVTDSELSAACERIKKLRGLYTELFDAVNRADSDLGGLFDVMEKHSNMAKEGPCVTYETLNGLAFKNPIKNGLPF